MVHIGSKVIRFNSLQTNYTINRYGIILQCEARITKKKKKSEQNPKTKPNVTFFLWYCFLHSNTMAFLIYIACATLPPMSTMWYYGIVQYSLTHFQMNNKWDLNNNVSKIRKINFRWHFYSLLLLDVLNRDRCYNIMDRGVGERRKNVQKKERTQAWMFKAQFHGEMGQNIIQNKCVLYYTVHSIALALNCTVFGYVSDILWAREFPWAKCQKWLHNISLINSMTKRFNQIYWKLKYPWCSYYLILSPSSNVGVLLIYFFGCLHFNCVACGSMPCVLNEDNRIWIC